MKKQTFVNIFLILPLFLLSLSCGKTHYGDKDPSILEFEQAIISGGSPLTSDETDIAIRVCFAFKSKGIKFKALKVGELFRYIVNETKCDGTFKSENLNLTLGIDINNSDNLYFKGPTHPIKYNTDVFTDKEGPLVEACAFLLKGDTPLNVFEKGDFATKISFFVKNGRDYFQLRRGQRENTFSQTYDVTSIKNFEVMTDLKASGDFYGLVSYIEEKTICQGKTGTYVKTQQYTDSF